MIYKYCNAKEDEPRKGIVPRQVWTGRVLSKTLYEINACSMSV